MRVETLVVGPFQTNCYVVSNKSGHALVIDPGYDAEDIVRFLKKNGFHVTAYLLTHGHVDHVWAAADAQAAVNAPMAIHEKDAAWVFDTGNRMEPYYPPPKPGKIQRVLGDGQEFDEDGFRYRIIWTPGHSPGSVCLYFAGDDILFSGDTLFAGSVGRADLPGGNAGELSRSLRKMGTLRDSITVYPGHGPQTVMSVEKKTNPFMSDADLLE